ncbi:MAG: hypothetical protein AB7S48_16915 [Bacteroidales bacterium]
MIRSLTLLAIIFLFATFAFSQNESNIELTKSTTLTDSTVLHQNTNCIDVVFPKLVFSHEFIMPNTLHFNSTINTNPESIPSFRSKSIALTNNEYSFNDFSRSTFNRTNGNIQFSTGSTKNTVLGYGEYILISKKLQWNPDKNFELEVGGFLGKQFNFFDKSQSNIVGLNAQSIFSLNNSIQFKVWGEYVSPFKQNQFKGNPFFPNTNVGSSFLFNLKNKTQLDVGVKYRYYENKMNWNLESVSRISIGF